ncbi:MAG: TraR/DksA C4-type zinc finger protein [Candidatus Nealsonbacteria bacterium]|nr:TraR/DksA C4-type zinc finger protein [Candidatus Nealsonbacteria bacterium]
MNPKQIQEFKEKLEKEKNAVEEQLQTIAEKDSHLKDDWDSKYPRMNSEFGGSALEIGADEVEAYGNRLPVEYALELKLKDINIALSKIATGGYGKCENCKKDIDDNRLEVYPEARLCMNCRKK